MKQLEEKIIRDMYVLETKKMSASFVLKVTAVILSGGVAFILSQVLWELMSEEKTFDVLAIFNDDAEIVRRYLGDIVAVIFQETPKGLLLVIGIFLSLFLFTILTFVLRFGKMKHKFTAVWKYWQNRNTSRL